MLFAALESLSRCAAQLVRSQCHSCLLSLKRAYDVFATLCGCNTFARLMQFEGGDKPLPGIAKSNAKDSVAAPLTSSQA